MTPAPVPTKVTPAPELIGNLHSDSCFTSESLKAESIVAVPSLLKKSSTHLGQLRESNGEFGRCAQGTPELRTKKLKPACYRSTSRSVLLSDESVFTHGFINTTLSTATFMFKYKQQEFAIT